MTWLEHFWLPIRTFLLALLCRILGLPNAQSSATKAAARLLHERQAQLAKWGAGTFPTGGLGFGGAEAMLAEAEARRDCEDAMDEGRCTFAHIIREEVAELLASHTNEDAIAEASQVGALMIKLIEYLQHEDPIERRPLRIYVVAEPAQKLIAASLASVLHDRGHIIVSRWHKQATPKSDNTSRLEAIRERTKAIRSADVVVAWMVGGRPNEALSEVGYGLGFGKHTMLIKSSEDKYDTLFESEKHVRVVHLDDPNAMDVVADAFDSFEERVRKDRVR